jgi:hypothetical protein
LPYFHANEAAHRDGVFKGWTDAQIDVVSRKLIQLTRDKSDFGVAVAIDQDEYDAACAGHPMFPTPYAYALMNCLYGTAHWRDATHRTAPTTFFFEQGHKHANDAHQFLTFMLKGDELPGRIGYRSHAFVPKDTPQVQAGDLLAWLVRLQLRRFIEGDPRPVRKDLQALMRPTDHFVHYDRQRIEHFRESILRNASEVEDYVREFSRTAGLPRDLAEYAASWMPDYRKTRPLKARVPRKPD